MPYKTLHRSQRRWAKSHGISVSDQGYTKTLSDNLLVSMSSDTASEFGAASGHELRPASSKRPPKMHALHSSSALACNIFDYWRTRDPESIGIALGLPSPVERMQFEAQFPTGLPGEPPNLDIAFWLISGRVVGVECKFTEPFCGRRSMPPFKEKYFSGAVPVWSARGLPRAGRLAMEMQDRRIRFRYLDAAQLLKHALGLHSAMQDNFKLIYLYMRGNVGADAAHDAEIVEFATAIGDEFDFEALTYQALFSRLHEMAGPSHERYFEYIGKRYFGAVDA